jgi:hypothetical protein
MGILARLEKNKGTVSSALSKALARKALAGDPAILDEAIRLATYRADEATKKGVRSAAAKIVELVAEERPDLVAPRLDEIERALSVKEPQTRWMAIRIMGFCAASDPAAAKRALPSAADYIRRKEGLCIASSADLFLGDYGALSGKTAAEAFPLLEASCERIMLNEQDWLLEAFIKIAPRCDARQKRFMTAFAERWEYSARKTTKERVKKLNAVLGRE